MSGELEEDVHRMLVEDIEGYEQLEILLLLRSRPGEDWNRQRLATQLGIDQDTAGRALEHLLRRNLLERRGGGTEYRFGPRSPGLIDTVARLAAAYADERRLKVMRLMNASAMQRLRNNAVRAFADAFIVGKDKKDG